MAQKTEELPVNVDVDLLNGGTITYANEVIAIIAGVAANEIEGIAGMCISGGLSDIIGRNRNVTRGVKVEIGSEEASVDLYVVVEYGQPIQKVCHDVQENVRKAIESMTGLHVVRVDVHVQGVSFEQEKKEQEAIEAMNNPVLTQGEGEKPEDTTAQAADDDEEETKPAADVQEEMSSEVQQQEEETDAADQPDRAAETDQSL